MGTTELEHRPQLLIGGDWREASGPEAIDVFNPATGEKLTEVVAASVSDVDDAVTAAARAFETWSQLSLGRRVQYLHRMKTAVERDAESLAQTITTDQGKTLDEARGEIVRLVEAIECAAAAPMLFHSQSGNVATHIDARRVRIPLGVCAAITPFNFPAMNPTQFSAWALVCGNTLVLKASEQDPLASTHLVSLLQESGLPEGVLSLLHGQADVAKRLITHPEVAAVSCITSSPTARAVYEAATAAGKRVQANGGASNPIVVAEDADLEQAAEGIVTSAFGMAGQRCLAASRVIAVGDIHDRLLNRVVELASNLVLGDGHDPATTMGPVISAQSRDRIEATIEQAIASGARAALDGRAATPQGNGTGGYFIGATVLTGVDPDSPAEREEVFGPVINLHQAHDLDQAIALSNDTEFGNASTIYTSSGSTAREFELGSTAGNIGINAFPAPPMNYTMGGTGASFYGDIHVCGDGPLEFYTDHKLVISRW